MTKEEFTYGLLRSDFLYFLPLDNHSVVLDAGCGLGTHVFTISPFVEVVYGSDASEKNIAFCEERKRKELNSNVRFVHSDIEHLPFPPGFFDIIIAHERKQVSRLYSLLKPGGMIYFGTSHLKNWEEYRRSLHNAGFEKEPDVYLAYPNHELPRFLIPVQDAYALNFIVRMMSADKGVVGAGIRFLMRIPMVTLVIKRLFFSYATFTRK